MSVSCWILQRNPQWSDPNTVRGSRQINFSFFFSFFLQDALHHQNCQFILCTGHEVALPLWCGNKVLWFMCVKHVFSNERHSHQPLLWNQLKPSHPESFLVQSRWGSHLGKRAVPVVRWAQTVVKIQFPEGARVSPGSRSLHYKHFLYHTYASNKIRCAGWNVGQLGPDRVFFFYPPVMLQLTNLRVHLQCWEIIARVCSGNSSEFTFFSLYLFRLPSAMKSHQSVNNNQINKLLLNIFSIHKPSCCLPEIVYSSLF